MDCAQFGNDPRSSASLADWSCDFSLTKDFKRSARSVASLLSYGTPSRNSTSAQPMMPRPIRRLSFTVLSITASGYGFISMTSSRKRTASRTTRSISSQSIVISPFSARRANFETLREPRLHASFGSRGCSPHGLVASIWPISGVGLAGLALIRSRKTIPGSPVRQAAETIRPKTSRAESWRTIAPV